MKKIKLRKIEPVNSKIISVKVIFLVILLALGFTVSRFVKKPLTQNNQSPKKNVNLNDLKNPLGDVKGLTDQFSAENLKKKSEDLANDLVDETINQIGKTASIAGETAQSIVYDAALRPFVDQFNKLPKEQQELLRKDLCR